MSFESYNDESSETNFEVETETKSDDECKACMLKHEFIKLVKDGIHWNIALDHVLHVVLESRLENYNDGTDNAKTDDEIGISDEEFIISMENSYSLGYGDGLKLGVEKAATLLNELVEYTDEQVAEYQAERELDEKSEEIEDISDEDYEIIEKLIRENTRLD